MSPRFARLTMIAAGLSLAVTTVIGQAPAPGSPTRQPSGGGPYRAPRSGDGKPNLNGIWQALNTASWDIEAHAAAPGLIDLQAILVTRDKANDFLAGLKECLAG